MTSSMKLLIFVVAYNARNHIENVLNRIYEGIWNKQLIDADILVIDDCSPDDTYQTCVDYAVRTGRHFILQRNDINKGYGGNQKIGYQYAIDHGYDLVILLHGDGQYDPALIPKLIAPIVEDKADVVIGSRMINKKNALKGGMPLYKFVGNVVTTQLQNLLLGVQLSEFHSGYRVYSIHALKTVPFQHNADYFDFDTDILIQMIDTRQRFAEIAIPTFYGSEICHVNGAKYVAKIMVTTVLSRLQRLGLYYTPKFDYKTAG